MIEIDSASPVPLNEQIKAGLKGLVAKGLLKPGDQAPSIRGLAQALRVNPNTVARAFRELTQEGFLEPRRGDGNYVAGGAARQARDGFEGLRERVLETLRLARRGGLPWKDIEKLVSEAQGGES